MAIAEISAGITAVKASLEAGKSIRDLIQRPDVDRHEVEKHLHEMLIHLGNVHFALNDAALEVQELRREVDGLRAQQATADDMEICQDGGFYVRKAEKAQGVFNPYCPVCFGLTRQPVPLVPMASGYYSCAIHRDASYQTKAYREAEQRRIQQRRADESHFEIIPGPGSWMAR